MNRMFLLFILVLALLAGFSSNVLSSTYNFYHVAVRDYNGNGLYDQKDHVRYGFDYSDSAQGFTAKAYDAVGGNEIASKDVDSPWLYKESFNGGAFTDQSYYGIKFNVNGIQQVKLFDGNNIEIAGSTVSVPDINSPLPSAYKGYDPLTVSWQWNGDNLNMSWDGITNQSSLASSHRLVMEINVDGINYSTFNWLDENTTNATFSRSVLDGLVDWDDTWTLHFEQRFENGGSGDNFNWLRSYSGFYDCNFSENGSVVSQLQNPVPIPGSILLLGSGIIGLIGFKSRKK